MGALNELDRTLFLRIAVRRLRGADPWLPRLSALDLSELGKAEHLAVDGEAVPAPDGLRLAKAARSLTVYRPRHPAVP